MKEAERRDTVRDKNVESRRQEEKKKKRYRKSWKQQSEGQSETGRIV